MKGDLLAVIAASIETSEKRFESCCAQLATGARQTTAAFGLIFAVLGIVPFGIGSALAEEAPRTINDCEKIQAADAYNQCLASFGPVAHEHGKTIDPENGGGSQSGAAPSKQAEAPAKQTAHSSNPWSRYRPHHRYYGHWTRHSRQRAEFRVR